MPPAKRAKTAHATQGSMFELRYFPLMAKGLGPALVAEHSGWPWSGNATLKFTIDEHWKELKPTTPFGQLPLLTVPGNITFQLAQTTAIVNYIGNIAHSDGIQYDQVSARDDLPRGSRRYAMSQQLIAEAEDIYNLMVKFLPTLYKQLSSVDGSVVTSKGTAADYSAFWAELLPPHLASLERLIPFNPEIVEEGMHGHRRCSTFLAGELHLFAMLYQAFLVSEKLLEGFPKLATWFKTIKDDARSQRVLGGQSPMGKLEQYFLSIDSDVVCRLGDERGRWG